MTRVRSVLAAAACGLLLVACGSEGDAETVQPAAPGATASEATLKGESVDGALLGRPLRLPDAQILYAARRGEVDVVSIGRRDGKRIVRTIPSVLTPEDVEAPDGIDLYGGDVLGDRGPDDRVATGTYLLVGSVPGDVEVSVTRPDGSKRPVTGASTETLHGYTVFYDAGVWDQEWDQVQLAPLAITTSDGRSVAVRDRSWVG